MKNYEELLSLAEQLQAAFDPMDEPTLAEPLSRLEQAVSEIRRSASGSWLGYQANIYYEGFKPPPAGKSFSMDKGIHGLLYEKAAFGNWVECQPDNVREYIYKLAGNPDLSCLRQLITKAISTFNSAKRDAFSIIEIELKDAPDAFLERINKELDQLTETNSGKLLRAMQPAGSFRSHDTRAIEGGMMIPPHLYELAEILALKHNMRLCRDAAELLRKAGSHLERKFRKNAKAARVGTNVFIGHGRSLIWRELKDFIEGRLSLPTDEFNRVPIAGITNIARLSEMLDAAAVAFIIMTGEDETADGATQARMNVIHEVGLFQGRLGFTRAFVLLEEGCAQFSNIEGLGQIRFPKGRISASFEEIRQVLERENLIKIE